MSTAVVFDSAGTLLHTFRVVKDVFQDTISSDVETTTLAYTCKERALILLYAHSREIMDSSPDQLLSTFLRGHNTEFGVSCASKAISSDKVAEILYQDKNALIGDLQECIRKVWECCKKEETIIAMNSGVMINQNLAGIEFTITSGGRPFPGAKSTIRGLHEMGVATYVASGDSTDKLIKMADHLGIPHDNVHGVATPAIKAEVVSDLKHHYDTVVMVGDGINDLSAMKRADLAILTEQQSDKKNQILRDAADHIITDVTEVVEIISMLNR